jgi:hypothetical protein
LDIGRSVQYWMSDPQWIKKVLIGAVLFIVPIIGWLIIGGYYIRTVQRISQGADVPLPEWDQWGDDLVRGLKFLGVMIIWLLPVWAISVCAVMIGVIDEGAGSAAGLMLNCLGFIYSIAFYFIYPILVARLAQTEQFGDAFAFAEIIRDAQKIPSQLLIFVVMWFVISIVASFGVILCFVGVFITGFIAYLISAHLVAQIGGMLGYGSTPRGPEPTPAV